MTSNASLIHQQMVEDPYLIYKPASAYSYATQLALNGIIFTLLVVLTIHLLFTVQHHYPLARLNFLLQFSGVIVTLAAVTATLAVTLRVGEQESSIWPYMNDFIYVEVPVRSWSASKLISWYTVEALSSGIVQITHIQFLTLLYPSALEARLIFGLLGPMALASSAMTFTALSPSSQVVRYGLIIRNICNSTLTLLFTSALFIWGFVINRKRAWRTDGGTAAFGAGALILAVSGTAVNFIEIKIDKLSWLQHLILSIILWQMWLGWWWWVGSGMGIGEVEDMLEKEHRKTRKAEQRQRRKEKAAAAVAAASISISRPLHRRLSTMSVTEPPEQGSTSSSSAFGGAFSRRHTRRTFSRGETSHQDDRAIELDKMDRHRVRDAGEEGEPSSSTRRERRGELDPIYSGDTEDDGFMRTIPDHERERDITLPHPVTTPNASATVPVHLTQSSRSWLASNRQAPSTVTTGLNSSSSNSSTASPTSLQLPTSISSILAFPATLINYSISRLSRAHTEAAKQRVIQGNPGAVANERRGWGLGQFGVEEARDGKGRIKQARREARRGRLMGDRSNDPWSTDPGSASEPEEGRGEGD
ncbi:hypothetical protein [Phaffia rhodozyma]|uniref:Uncharacterized protein n=1 Tax=Phaffia rhodozyma TaxID=264483 RepID=A0A0F7SG34_PHARH|nr:hypothetical protein [Phaffia rhodozyma]